MRSTHAETVICHQGPEVILLRMSWAMRWRSGTRGIAANPGSLKIVLNCEWQPGRHPLPHSAPTVLGEVSWGGGYLRSVTNTPTPCVLSTRPSVRNACMA